MVKAESLLERSMKLKKELIFSLIAFLVVLSDQLTKYFILKNRMVKLIF